MTRAPELLRIEGTCAPGFEAVREVFASGADDLGDGGGAFCAYVGGEKVVDLWAGVARPGVPWAEETLAVLMSSTKGLVALCAQILEAHGQLDIDATVATYWPEFAQAGKDVITVRHVLTHTAGVLGVPGHTDFMGWDGRGFDNYDEIARRIASATPAWEPGTEIGYHALTYGWIMGEIIRRITEVSVGTFFRDNVAAPLDLETFVGTPASEVGRVAPVINEDYSKLPPEILPLLETYMSLLRDPTTLAGQAMLGSETESFIDKIDTFASNPDVLRLELPAGNGTSTARSLAKVYALLAGGGELDGVRLLPRESVETWGTEQVRKFQTYVPIEMSQALGYHGNIGTPGGPTPFGPNPKAFGHGGAGGQVGCCDLDNGVAIGFVRSQLSSVSTLSAQLIDAVYERLR